MFGKIVQILGVPGEERFEVIYGVDCEDFLSLNFGKVFLGNIDPKVTKTSIYGGHIVTPKRDGFKDLIIFNGNLAVENQEEYLLVIIPYAHSIVTSENVKILAGRYHSEGVLEMRNGDTVKVSKNFGNGTVYMAVQAGNEILLVEKSR